MILPQYTISDSDLKIFDSYKVSKKDFCEVLYGIERREPNYKVWCRAKWLMSLEWATHNALYCLHIKRSSTKDVDLNYPLAWYEKFGYTIVGAIVWLFIK